MKITNERMTHHMTKEEKLRVLEKAEEKCFTCLYELSADDMSSDRVGSLLGHINSLQYTAYCLKNPDRSDFTPPPPPEPDTVSEEQPDDPVPTETAAEAPEAEDDDPAEEPESGEASSYDLDEIRVILNRLHRAGKINVAEIFETMGYRTLSEIPASEYGRLMQLAGVE